MYKLFLRNLALISACNARVEGMRAENKQREVLGESMAYTEQDFAYEAAELERLSYEVIQDV